MGKELLEKAEALGAKIESATTSANPDEAKRVKAALNTLETLKSQAQTAKSQFSAASNNTQKQTVVLNTYPALLDGLTTLLDILSGTIKAVVKED